MKSQLAKAHASDLKQQTDLEKRLEMFAVHTVASVQRRMTFSRFKGITLFGLSRKMRLVKIKFTYVGTKGAFNQTVLAKSWVEKFNVKIPVTCR